ncbi:hypothetical protein V473_20690 [Sphingobium cupriresistens LL01]|uniref:Uncharacterized protein n=1 Tax=Sphingobium cupriresistens LL01 TaxID=1420583 RepID=A0A0J7XJR1_9SPHN|nr:hypothetical protein C100_01795 [Sphingobium sp. C100]KMS52271.1 hypothetical protein V473_20690 [Sphingobium cupriresistens LL01]
MVALRKVARRRMLAQRDKAALCNEFIRSQRQEIDQVKALLARNIVSQEWCYRLDRQRACMKSKELP